ncbi:MAG: dihydrofolate reductase [Chloroflexi bacterium]|nr:dihydrofolate reductase [Chloroflexota bacterium]OJV88808.1 MAG: riboflavin biosynthesis protein RibD [Chloroflexi bacterium 54-19]
MGKIVAGMTMSLDGFVKGQDGNFAVLYPAFDELLKTDLMQETFATTGSVVMGRTSYEMCQGDFTDYEFQVPLFILTHSVPTVVARGENDKLSFHFVTDGVESLIRQAKVAAGDKDVTVVGGANTIQQCLKNGLIDELQIDIMPVLLGGGLRLFENLEKAEIKLEKVKVFDLPGGGTEIRFRVLK